MQEATSHQVSLTKFLFSKIIIFVFIYLIDSRLIPIIIQEGSTYVGGPLLRVSLPALSHGI